MRSIVLLIAVVLCGMGACKPKSATNTVTTTDSTGAVVTTEVPAPAEVKIGYLSSAELLSVMPEVKAADKKLESFMQKKESSFNALMKKYEDKVKYLQNNAQNISPVEQESKMKELTGLEQQLQTAQARGQQDVAVERERLYAPILSHADSIIKKIGEEEGYAFIYNSSAGLLLYADTTKNLLPLVKERLGLTNVTADPKLEQQMKEMKGIKDSPTPAAGAGGK